MELLSFIAGAVFGASCLELFWYERRRRNHRTQDAQLKEIDLEGICQACSGCGILELNGDKCPFCDGSGKIL